jgi:hypothetical protein
MISIERASPMFGWTLIGWVADMVWAVMPLNAAQAR